MSKVSTRPQKSATSVAAPETPVAAQAHQSPTRSQAQAPLSPVGSTALSIVERAKVHHEQVPDCPVISVHCLTLLDLAVDALQRFSATAAGAEDTGGPAADLAYEIAALLAGALALDVVDTPEAIDRHVMLEHAYKLMDEAAMSFGLMSGPCVALAIGVQAGAVTKATKCYSVQQLHEALELIACRASTLESMLIDLGERCVGTVPASELATAVNGATIVANSIGGVADEMSGGDIVGNWETWTFGHNFAKAGKAVQS